MRTFLLSALAGALLLAAPAHAATESYRATLSGSLSPTQTGSTATGKAKIRVDRDARTVDVTLEVRGLTIDKLWDRLVPAPVGPIHLHIYAATDHDHSGDTQLLMPLPYGPTYTATRNGFRVRIRDFDYAQGATIVGGKTTFDEFVHALDHGAVVLNIHTDAFNDGEISGEVVPASGRKHAHH